MNAVSLTFPTGRTPFPPDAAMGAAAVGKAPSSSLSQPDLRAVQLPGDSFGVAGAFWGVS